MNARSPILTTGLAKYSQPSAIKLERNDGNQNIVALLSIRAERPEFNGAGVLAAIVRKPSGGFLLQVTKQYQIGGKQYLEHTVDYDNVRDAYKFASGFMKTCYNTVIQRKFTVDILGGAL